MTPAQDRGRRGLVATAWTLACKDFRLASRDRTGLLLGFALPIFLATIFAAAMGGMGGSDGQGRVTFLVEDLDQSEASRALVALLAKQKGLRVKADHEVRRKVADGKAPAALLVPSGYGADLDADHAAPLKLYRDPGQTIEQQIVAGNLLAALLQPQDARQGKRIMKRGLAMLDFPKEWMPAAEGIFDQTWTSISALPKSGAGDGSQPDETPSSGEDQDLSFAEAIPELLGVEVEDVAGQKDEVEKAAGQAHAVSGIAVMMLLFGLVACGGTLLEEQSEGTLQRLQLTPAPGAAILLGKFLFTGLMGLAQLAILFTYGGLVFDVPILRSPVALIALSIAIGCAATGLGLLLAVVCRTRKQLEGLSTLVILVMSALGGSWFPLIMTPEWYRKLGHFTLNAWAMDGLQGIFWYGKNLGGIALEIGVLLAIGAVTSALAARGWKRRFGTA